MNDMQYDILVFSHLRWDSVTQRPQHIMNRLSQKYKILFIEEPIDIPESENEGRRFSLVQVSGNLSVFTPHFRGDNWKAMCERYVELLQAQIGNVNNTLFWFYSPSFVHVLYALEPKGVIYDCMDELSAFRNASRDLPAYEKLLMSRADTVFTGGKSIYHSKKGMHPNVYCFPSSVDKQHFSQALNERTVVPADIQELKKPVVGYYGVIDERIDFELLAKVAAKLPDMTFVMIGPFAKIDEADIAIADNIIYMGKKDYVLLPAYLKGMDVAIMPFAMNDATRFISPTKTLEYMAALKPIVSTPVTDVVADYSHVVEIANNADEFAASIMKCVNESGQEADARKQNELTIVDTTSWDNTVKKMEEIINNMVNSNQVTLKAPVSDHNVVSGAKVLDANQ